jgi:hypothetical protein
MNDGPNHMAQERLTQALSRLDQQLADLTFRLDQHLAAPPPVDDALVARHDALKSEVAAVIAELDSMVGTAADSSGLASGATPNG